MLKLIECEAFIVKHVFCNVNNDIQQFVSILSTSIGWAHSANRTKYIFTNESDE